MYQQGLPGLMPKDEAAALAAAYRRVPGLVDRMSFEKAIKTECVAHCLRVMVGLKNRRRAG